MSKALTQHQLLELLRYDPETGKLFWHKRPASHFESQGVADWWNSQYANKEAFTAVSAQGYRVGAINNIGYRAHRVIFVMLHGYEPDQIDHINGIRADNRAENLRDVPGAVNQKNMKLACNNKSGVTGVFWNEKKNRWIAYITSEKKRMYLGYFTDFDEAVRVRAQAEIKHGFHPNHGRK